MSLYTIVTTGPIGSSLSLQEFTPELARDALASFEDIFTRMTTELGLADEVIAGFRERTRTTVVEVSEDHPPTVIGSFTWAEPEVREMIIELIT